MVDQRWWILPRYTQPSPDTKMLSEKLKLQLPSQPPPHLVAQEQGQEIEQQLYGRRLFCGESLFLT
jgi:hypothetical protein